MAAGLLTISRVFWKWAMRVLHVGKQLSRFTIRDAALRERQDAARIIRTFPEGERS